MENLKEFFHKSWMRHYFWFILVIVIQFSLLIIHYSQAPPELDRKCPEDGAKLLDTISQLQAENLSLKKQLAVTEKEKQRVKKVADQTLEKTLQLLEKSKEEADGLIKQLSVSNQSLVEARHLLQKAKEEVQSLQSQLEIAKEDLRKIQEQRDSWQNQLAEIASLKTQLVMVEKAKDRMENATDQNLEKTRQLLEKAKKDNHGLQEQLAISNRTLAETKPLLEKANKDIRGLQMQLEATSQNYKETQEHLDSCQNQLHMLEEKLKSPDSETKEIQKSHEEIKQLKQQLSNLLATQQKMEQQQGQCWSRVTELQSQIHYQQKKCSIQDILDDGSILGWGVGILVLFLCCVKCCRPES